MIRVVRPDDLVVLEVGWTCVHVPVEVARDARRAVLVPEGPTPGVLAVRLPPQPIVEDAFFEAAAGHSVEPQSSPQETLAPPPVVSRIAAASRAAGARASRQAGARSSDAKDIESITAPDQRESTSAAWSSKRHRNRKIVGR